ncbi:hypothetical protein [Staphylococcus agnetis]|uniref:hypothetical protein n=2 Tax=Staphylococcus agnetis TaxID=985762 RepID=UPI000D0408B2|nr:hypothetical protein [Staphylococcus agnetis]NJH68429.1 hypothetical protein [Staphylococcus agnetis]
MLDLKKLEHSIQLKSYNLNTISLVKKDENVECFESPYKITSDQIEFKIYPMTNINEKEIPILIIFIIDNNDFKLKLEYKSTYLVKEMDLKDEGFDSLLPIVFWTMYKKIKSLSTHIIQEIVNTSVDFPIYSKRKLTE